MKVVSLIGARPQFIQGALVGEAVREAGAWEHVLGHYDRYLRMRGNFRPEAGCKKRPVTPAGGPERHQGVFR